MIKGIFKRGGKLKQIISSCVVATMALSMGLPSVVTLAEEEESSVVIDVTDFGADPSGKNDSAVAIYEALESAKKYEEPVIINFPKGEYNIYKDYSQKREYHTSNTNSIENPIKTIGILIEEQKDLTLEGNGSMFIMHGNMMAVAIAKSENVKLQNFEWDFEVPTTTDMTVKDIGVEDGKNYVDYFIPSNFRYEIVDNDTNVLWTSEKSPYTGQYYWSQKGNHDSWSTVIYNPDTESTRRHSTSEAPFNRVNNIRKLGENVIRVKYNGAVPAGQTLGAVNEMLGNSVRETAGAFIWESKDTVIENVDVHYMHGFGWLTQMSENVTFDAVNFMPRVGTGKYTTSFADLIHVSGASGKITIKNSNFSHAHDDPINIHGTFTRVEEKIDSRTLKVKYIERQQGGFPQYYIGDEVTFFTRDTLMSPNNEEVMYKVVESTHPGQDGNDLRTMIVKFDKDLPEDIDSKIGNEPKYVVENVTYTPEIEIKNNIFHTIPTRGILSTTRKPVLIEGNTFKNMAMATIFLSNDSNDWYESGPIRDLTISDNKFYISKTDQDEWADRGPIFIHPVTKGGTLPSADSPIHKNITIEKNEFYMEHERMVTAESVENLVIRNNKMFRQNPDVNLDLSVNKNNINVGENISLNLVGTGSQNVGSTEDVFSFKACKNVLIEGNTYDDGLIKNAIVRDMPLEYIDNRDSEITLNGSRDPSAPISNIKYTSLNPDIATVSSNGEVTGVNSGEATIVAYYMWNNTAIKSNEVVINVTTSNVERPESFKIINDDNEIINEKNRTIQFDTSSTPEDIQGNIIWSVNDVDGTSTDKATISEDGLVTGKSNGIVVVTANLNGVYSSKSVIISFEKSEGLSPSFEIVNENKNKWETISNSEFKLTLEVGDLYANKNDAKNIVLYDIPENINKNNMRASIKISNLPLKQNNRWDNGGIYLFKDTDNYISVGKKSHFDGVVTVKEVSGVATEIDKSISVQESELIFDVYKNGNEVVINYKTPNGQWKEWGSVDASALGNDYKIAFAGWNHDGRAYDINFSEFKVADGSEYTKDSIRELEDIKFTGVKNNAPVVSSVVLNKENSRVGEEISLNYDYSDIDNHNEENSIYRWDLEKEGETISYFTSVNTFIPEDTGNLSCVVYPRDAYGSIGTPITSNSIVVESKELVESSAELSNIKINNTLIEKFSKDNMNYIYSSINTQKELNLSVSAYENTSKVVLRIDGEIISEGIGEINEKVDVDSSKRLLINVTSPNGEVNKEYTIDIKKYDDNFASLESISIPELNLNESGKLKESYMLNTSYATDSITFKSTAKENIGSINLYTTEYRTKVENTLNKNNEFEAKIKLLPGNNTFYVEGLGKDGITKETSIINIVRSTDSIADINDIKINGNSIDGFEKDKFNYILRLDNRDSKKVNIEAIKESNSNVSITVNGVRTEEESREASLEDGLNSIIITSKGDDLWSTKYYEIKVIVKSGSNSKLLKLEIPNNYFEPSFNPDVNKYAINTSKQLFELNAVAQEEDASIEVSINNNKFNGVGEINASIKLTTGENTAIVKVISKDKSSVTEYKININANEYVYISDLQWEPSSTVGYGSFMRDLATNGGPITLVKDGETTIFNKGIGAHAPSTLIFNIDGKGYEKFESFVGVDYSQSISGNGSVTFKVLLDGVESFNSGELYANSESKFISLELKGVKEVKLVASEGANNSNDHSVWAGANFKSKFEDVEITPPDDIVVSKVKNLKSADITSSSVKLNWEKPENIVGLTEYIIYKDGKELTRLTCEETEYVIDNLKSNTIYGFKVVAKYSNGEISKPKSINIRTKK